PRHHGGRRRRRRRPHGGRGRDPLRGPGLRPGGVDRVPRRAGGGAPPAPPQPAGPGMSPHLPAVLLGGLAVVPLTGEYPALVGTLAVVFALVALSFVVLTGWTGDVTLGQVVPYGLGAYGAYVLSDRVGLPVALAIVVAAVATVPLLVNIGTPALRLRGLDL